MPNGGPAFRSPGEHRVRDLARAIDLIGVDLRFQIIAEALQEGVALIAIFRALDGKRLQRLKLEAAHEETADKSIAGLAARRLRQFERRALFGDISSRYR